MAKHNKKISAVESEAVVGAYGCIEAFITAWGLTHGKKVLNKILTSAMSRKPSTVNPSTVIYYFKTLKSLVQAVLLIQKTGYSRQAAILTPPDNGLPDLSRYEDYCGMYSSDIWIAFPRMLSKKEYFNPYIVFKKTSTYANEEDWDFILDELQDYTFYNSSFAELGDEHNVLTLQRLLQKQVEACYLIFTRTINNRWWDKGKLVHTNEEQIEAPVTSEEDPNKKTDMNTGEEQKTYE